jgi:hypothetical protein
MEPKFCLFFRTRAVEDRVPWKGRRELHPFVSKEFSTVRTSGYPFLELSGGVSGYFTTAPKRFPFVHSYGRYAQCPLCELYRSFQHQTSIKGALSCEWYFRPFAGILEPRFVASWTDRYTSSLVLWIAVTGWVRKSSDNRRARAL